jgi:DNA-binding GntR family transcriptional regulator
MIEQMSWNLTPVERSSTLEQVHRVLRDAIVTGRIPPGAHLREIHLARELATSRSTVREAIRHLVQEGLVEYVLHRGNFVNTLSLRDRLDVYVAREAIEVGVVRQLLRRDEPLDLDPIEAAFNDLREAAVGHTRPTEREIASDLRFHQELIALAGSARLDRAYDTLAAETRMLLRHHPVYPWQTYVRDHELLLDALRARDPRLPELVSEHLVLSADLIGGELDAEAREGSQVMSPATGTGV